MNTWWNFSIAGQLSFGRGAVQQLGRLVPRHAVRRALIVTDSLLVKLGAVAKIQSPLESAGAEVEVFSEGEAEPSIKVAQCAIDAARDFRPDAIVGLGGGSNMDLAKITATVYTHGGTPRDYFGFDNVPGPVLTLVCVPTTAGTGSEVSHAAVLTDTQNEIKVSTLSPFLRPDAAVVDPELTYTCPKTVTADSGIDALTHAIEGYTATRFDRMEIPEGESCAYDGSHPLGDCLAERAIQLIGHNLTRVVQDPDDYDARDAMALASTLAGIAFSNCGVALVHALEYPVGAALHCSHGAGNGLLLPYVMRFNLPECTAKFARIAALLGEDLDGMSEQQAAEQAIEGVISLRHQIGIPLRITDLGGSAQQLPEFAEKAFAVKRLMWVNPRRASQQDLLSILQEAL